MNQFKLRIDWCRKIQHFTRCSCSQRYCIETILSAKLLWCRVLLHFAWVVDDAKCIVVTRVCVSVCVCLRTYAHTTARTRMWLGGVVEAAPSCALLGGFAIGAPVTLLWQHNANPSLRGVGARCWIVTGGWRRRSQHYCGGLDYELPMVAFWQHNANAKC